MNHKPQKYILIRLPNWVGDVIMSLPFIEACSIKFPEYKIHVIIKNGLAPIMDFVENIDKVIPFSRDKYKGLKGGYQFGKEVSQLESYDLFFSLPNSFSAAWSGFFTGAKKRVGYKNEFRSFLLSDSYETPPHRHRTEDYLFLLESFLNEKTPSLAPNLKLKTIYDGIDKKGNNLLLNINSEAFSRRIPIDMAVELILLLKNDYTIYLTGAPNEEEYVNQVTSRLPVDITCFNMTGKTDLKELFKLVGSMDYVVSTDSGIAHISNAFGVKTVVLFGAGNEKSTRPYNNENLKLIRKSGLECAPCVSNTCIFHTPKCLSDLNLNKVIEALKEL